MNIMVEKSLAVQKKKCSLLDIHRKDTKILLKAKREEKHLVEVLKYLKDYINLSV